MILRSLSIAVFCFLSAVSTSCVVLVENQIAHDPEVDERLVGVWKAVWRSEDEVLDPKSPRYIDDIGASMIIVGESEPDELTFVGIDGFGPDGIELLGHYAGRTREEAGKKFLLLERTTIPGTTIDADITENFQVVLEYDFNEDGDLFLWFALDFREMVKMHSLKHEFEEGQFSPVLITATSEELLEFYSDPEVSRLMSSAGKYRKMTLPEGNSPPVSEEPPR